ncbi:MAG: dephospho-CoA kinase [Gemmatimonadetes bacterium]|nr:dephospho-CoA kinase [Gemmatimonadota bacterium]NNM05329.1 dephospho-CoA kinase [Gemmatimonadota bacterium]
MLTVGLTGNVASGKTTVATIWSRAGVPVIRADDLARKVVAPGTRGLSRVVEEFGPEVLRVDGGLDRDALRDRVFRDEAKRLRLEEILHPLIEARRKEWFSREQEEGSRLVVAEIPLLFEAGLEGGFGVVVLVVAPREVCLRRLTEDRGLDPEEASRIMGAQIPVEEKIPRVDYVLENGSTTEDLELRALALLDLLRARARKEEVT